MLSKFYRTAFNKYMCRKRKCLNSVDGQSSTLKPYTIREMSAHSTEEPNVMPFRKQSDFDPIPVERFQIKHPRFSYIQKVAFIPCEKNRSSSPDRNMETPLMLFMLDKTASL